MIQRGPPVGAVGTRRRGTGEVWLAPLAGGIGGFDRGGARHNGPRRDRGDDYRNKQHEPCKVTAPAGRVPRVAWMLCAHQPLDPARHSLGNEVKAITYHGLRVEPTADGWLAEVIVDI